MDREQVQRRGFSTSRRGYDPAEVDEHLRQVADELDRIRSTQGPQEGLAGVAADQIKGIVDAAERSAREIRERAETDAAEHVERVEAAAARLLERTQAVEAALEQLVEALGTEGRSFVEEVQHGEAPSPAAAPGAASSGGVADVVGEEERFPAESPPEEVPADEAEPVARREGDAFEAPAASEVAAAEPSEELPATAPAEAERPAITGSEGARLIALNMALNGASREETARYLTENFDIEDQDSVLDDVYSRIRS